MKEVLLNDILDAARSKRRPVFLILRLLSQKGHGPIQVVQTKRFNTFNAMIPAPLVAIPVGAGNKKTMKHGQEDGPLHIKFELAVSENTMKDLADSQFLPKPLKDQGGTDLLCRGLGVGVASGRKNQQDLLGKSGEGPDDGFDITACAKLIHPAYRGNNPLADFLPFPAVLDELEIFVAAYFLIRANMGAS